MVKEKKKKSKLKLKFKIIFLLLIIIIYSFTIGTKGIFTKDFNVKSNKIGEGLKGFKILQFSDLHYGSTINQNDLKKLVTKINQTKPDIVIFSGDLIDEKYKLDNNEKELIKDQLSKINAEMGKYYITGEEDFEESISILNLSNFINLDNGEQIIYGNTNESFLLTSEKSADNFFKNSEITNNFKILVIHDSNKLNDKIIKKYNFDMILSGHTHNGQINIPELKDFFIKGKYKKTYQKINNTKLFINPGIGTSAIKARLFNHPTIYLYRLSKDN